MKTITQLVDHEAPGLDLVERWVESATRPVELLPASGKGEDVLVALQVTTRVALGAIAHDTGGLLVDGGWLRILGAGSAGRLERSLGSWNRIGAGRPRLEGALLVGDDVLGGFFAWHAGDCGGQRPEQFPPRKRQSRARDELGIRAANGGPLPAQIPNTVWYLSPDSLEWEDTGLGYSDWLVWVLSGDLDGFYDEQRWSGWESEVALLSGDQVLALSPPVSSEGPPLGRRPRRAIPVEEAWAQHATVLPRERGLPFVEG